MNDYPPHYDDDVFEICVNGIWFAWESNLNVYQYNGFDGKNTERDDDFKLIGRLEPLDIPEFDPESHLRMWAMDYLQNFGKRK